MTTYIPAVAMIMISIIIIYVVWILIVGLVELVKEWFTSKKMDEEIKKEEKRPDIYR
jgi:hypothetical protein